MLSLDLLDKVAKRLDFHSTAIIFLDFFDKDQTSLNITRLHSTHSTRWPNGSIFSSIFCRVKNRVENRVVWPGPKQESVIIERILVIYTIAFKIKLHFLWYSYTVEVSRKSTLNSLQNVLRIQRLEIQLMFSYTRIMVNGGVYFTCQVVLKLFTVVHNQYVYH